MACTSAILAVGVGVLYAWKRRQERAVKRVFGSECGSSPARPAPRRASALQGKPGGLSQLGSAVNELLENLEQRGARLKDREQLFQRLVETVHDAVLVHRERILFANSRFLALLNLSAAEVIGKPLAEFVAPEYVELVRKQSRRRLLGRTRGRALSRSNCSARRVR